MVKHSIAEWMALLLPDPAVPGSNHYMIFFSVKMSDAAELMNSALPIASCQSNA